MDPKQEETDPDFELVQLAKSGDTHAFDSLVTKYDRKLFGIIYHMTSSTEDSNDLLQDTFSKAYESLGDFREDSSFYTWIHTITVNRTLNHLKKKKRRAGPSYDDDESGILNDPAFIDEANQANPRRLSTIHELHDKLNESLLKLSDDHRAVVTMFDVQSMHHAEISRVLGVSEGTVRSRLYYAHQQLQIHLKEFGNS